MHDDFVQNNKMGVIVGVNWSTNEDRTQTHIINGKQAHSKAIAIQIMYTDIYIYECIYSTVDASDGKIVKIPSYKAYTVRKLNATL